MVAQSLARLPRPNGRDGFAAPAAGAARIPRSAAVGGLAKKGFFPVTVASEHAF